MLTEERCQQTQRRKGAIAEKEEKPFSWKQFWEVGQKKTGRLCSCWLPPSHCAHLPAFPETQVIPSCVHFRRLLLSHETYYWCTANPPSGFWRQLVIGFVFCLQKLRAEGREEAQGGPEVDDLKRADWVGSRHFSSWCSSKEKKIAQRLKNHTTTNCVDWNLHQTFIQMRTCLAKISCRYLSPW